MKNKGITLIALVITIIVMLILVAVTISLTINGGLFNYAKRASAETKTAVHDEKEITNIPSGLGYNDLIGHVIENKIVDLTGTVWKFKDSVDIDGLPENTRINFKAKNNTYETSSSNSKIEKSRFQTYNFINFYGDANDFACLPENELGFSAGWVWGNLGSMTAIPTEAPTIEISGGQNATDSELIAWIEANAVKQ